MKSYCPFSLLIVFALLTLIQCTSKNSNGTNKEKREKSVDTATIDNSDAGFPLPPVPVVITNADETMLYLAKHYWDLFPFADTTLIAQPDITEQGFVDYIQLLSQISLTEAQNSMDTMLEKAKSHPTMYVHFATLYQKYLYDPNSPFRNEELYIPVVSHLLKSGLLTEADQSRYSFHQEMIMKNRIGTIAADFVYTLANGDKKKMHALQSSYLIVFFTNPGCPACGEVTEGLSNSGILKSIFSLNNPIGTNMLTVLSIYTDNNIDDWRKALPQMPQKHWVNGYDDGAVVINKRLYDIKAIPTLYLLNKNKKIILKDTTLEGIEEYFIKIS